MSWVHMKCKHLVSRQDQWSHDMMSWHDRYEVHQQASDLPDSQPEQLELLQRPVSIALWPYQKLQRWWLQTQSNETIIWRKVRTWRRPNWKTRCKQLLELCSGSKCGLAEALTITVAIQWGVENTKGDDSNSNRDYDEFLKHPSLYFRHPELLFCSWTRSKQSSIVLVL